MKEESPEKPQDAAPVASTEETAPPEEAPAAAEAAPETPAPAEEAAPPETLKKSPARAGVCRGTGRRKTSVARVRVRAGGGAILVNGRPFEQYFPSEQDRVMVLAPLKAAELAESLDVFARVEGGGLTGQSGAVRMGVARALREYNPGLELLLRRGGWLTRDARRKERKHYGRRGARRSFQWTKR